MNPKQHQNPTNLFVGVCQAQSTDELNEDWIEKVKELKAVGLK